MCLIEAFTRCDAFPVPQFTLVFSSQVSKESVCSCSRSLKVGLLKTLRLVLCSFHFGIHTMHGEQGRLAQEELTSWLSQYGNGSASLPCVYMMH